MKAASCSAVTKLRPARRGRCLEPRSNLRDRSELELGCPLSVCIDRMPMEYSTAYGEGDAAWRRRRWHLVLVIVLRQSTAIQEHVPDAGGQNHTTGTQRGKEIAWRSTSMPRNLALKPRTQGVPSGNLKACSSAGQQHSSTYLVRRCHTPCRRFLAVVITGGEPDDRPARIPV